MFAPVRLTFFGSLTLLETLLANFSSKSYATLYPAIEPLRSFLVWRLIPQRRSTSLLRKFCVGK